LEKQGLSSDSEIADGLKTLCALVLRDRKLSSWVNHPMPGYPNYHNRIWKWDFKPDNSGHSSTRKGWRLFAFVPDLLMSDPIPATAFFCYDKQNEPAGNPPSWISAVLQKFLAEESPAPTTEDEKFRRQLQPDGFTRSLCHTCYATVAVTADLQECKAAEDAHQCAGEINKKVVG
jgi:hypothetical protein